MRARTEAQTLALYEEAIDRLPPLSRVVFLLHRVDEVPYDQIAERLSITVPVVEACMIETLSLICATVDRKTYRPRPRETIAEAEAALHLRYRKQRSRGFGAVLWRGLSPIRHDRETPGFERWLLRLAGPHA